MAKYRIKRKRNLYIPQRRGLLFIWESFTLDRNANARYPRLMLMGLSMKTRAFETVKPKENGSWPTDSGLTLAYETEDEARAFIKEYKEWKSIKKIKVD